MGQHCIGEVHVIYERYEFNNRNQNIGENVDDYITSLRKMAQKCNFGTLSDDLIRDRIVCGILHNAVRRRLLEQLSLTLNQCIDKCRAAEATKAQMNGSVTSGSQDEINKLRRDLPSRKPKQPSQRFESGKEKIINCKCCGGSHEKWRESCRAFGKR